jgi:hypothetical protein
MISVTSIWRKKPAALGQPLWPKGVNYVFGTFCKGSLRTVQKDSGGDDWI